MKAFVDEARCQGHGRCYFTAPQVFAPKDDFGHSEVVCGDVPDQDSELVDAVIRAAASCPERAIVVEEE